jgi:hypothetical protein
MGLLLHSVNKMRKIGKCKKDKATYKMRKMFEVEDSISKVLLNFAQLIRF